MIHHLWLRRPKTPKRRNQKLRRPSLYLERLEDRWVPSTTWTEQGPGPILGEFNAVIPSQNNVAGGAVNAVAADPSNANIVWAATVGGGVWKTTDANDANPIWTPLTDASLPFLSTISIAISPFSSSTVYVGTGSTSSDGSQGVAFGIARTTDGGSSWTFAGPINLRIRKVLATPIMATGGEVILACTLSGNSSTRGLYRSDDGGSTYTRVSGMAGSGLPTLGVGDLVEDPGVPNRIYAAIPGGGAGGGVYKSEDGGLTWSQVNSGLSGFGSAIRAKLAAHFDASNDVVYAMFVNSSGGLAGVFRSGDQGASWVSLGAPSPQIYPGAQGSVHGALAADPTDPNVVYIAGDRQDPPFPNANGATSFSDNSFRGTFSPSGTSWATLDENGSNGTSPHPDSRSWAFDANGNLLQSNDGGVYRLNNPSNPASRIWVSINGNLRVTEFHSISFDPLSKVIFGGTQDNGTPVQEVGNKFTSDDFQGGDGGVVGVDGNQTMHAGTTIRYTSSQFFHNFIRSTWDGHNNFLGFTLNGLNIVAGAGSGMTLSQFDPNIQFYQPFVINNIDQRRMLIGTAQFYESLNQGDSLTDLGGFNGFFVGNGSQVFGQSMVYGGSIGKVVNADVFYGGIGPQIEFREHMGDPLSVVPGYVGAAVSTIAMNPRDYRNIYVVDTNSQVWVTFDKGATFSNITLNLGTLSPQIQTLIVLSPTADPTTNVLVAGGIGGVWALNNPTSSPTTTWAALGTNMPHTIVQDLHFDSISNVLVAGTLGRGAWTLSNPTNSTGPSTTGNPKPYLWRTNYIPNLDPQLFPGLLDAILKGDGGIPDPGAEEGNPPGPDTTVASVSQPSQTAAFTAQAQTPASPQARADAVSAYFSQLVHGQGANGTALFGNPFASAL
jgi:hypothetical protein